jgi:hypothetical protein
VSVSPCEDGEAENLFQVPFSPISLDNHRIDVFLEQNPELDLGDLKGLVQRAMVVSVDQTLAR